MSKAVLCIKNEGYEASLERWKVYPVLEEKHGLLRIVDESGESYLYPKDFFAFVDLPLHLLQELKENYKETH